MAKNTEFLARSIFSSFGKYGTLMTNDGALESWHQGKFVFGHLAVFREITKNINLVQGKQTVHVYQHCC